MKRFVPNELLTLLECWLSCCYFCVKWDNAWSEPFHLSFGVKHGSVLSLYLFALYLDDLTTKCLSVPGVCRVPTHPWKSLKVLEFFNPKFKALKVLENKTGAWKSLNFIPQVLESPWIYQVRLHDISNFVKQVFCLKQDLLIIVMFCFYQLKLSRNHRNRY